MEGMANGRIGETAASHHHHPPLVILVIIMVVIVTTNRWRAVASFCSRRVREKERNGEKLADHFWLCHSACLRVRIGNECVRRPAHMIAA